MLKLHRPYGVDFFFHSLDHCFGHEVCFPSRSLAGQEPGQRDSFGKWSNTGLVEDTW